MLDAHERIVVQFSGGKDSLACLYLCRPWWPKLHVVWCNPGNPYPETLAQMAHIRALVPHFIEVNGEQPRWVREQGLPVDVVPILATTVGQLVAGVHGPRLQSTFECCRHNLWEPLARAVIALRATLVVRGQKRSDDLQGPLHDGDVVDGVTYHYPLEGWSDADVRAYLHEQGVALPPQYGRGINTSFDCFDCTGYAAHNRARWAAMPDTHPDLWARFGPQLAAVRAELTNAMVAYG